MRKSAHVLLSWGRDVTARIGDDLGEALVQLIATNAHITSVNLANNRLVCVCVCTEHYSFASRACTHNDCRATRLEKVF